VPGRRRGLAIEHDLGLVDELALHQLNAQEVALLDAELLAQPERDGNETLSLNSDAWHGRGARLMDLYRTAGTYYLVAVQAAAVKDGAEGEEECRTSDVSPLPLRRADHRRLLASAEYEDRPVAGKKRPEVWVGYIFAEVEAPLPDLPKLEIPKAAEAKNVGETSMAAAGQFPPCGWRAQVAGGFTTSCPWRGWVRWVDQAPALGTQPMNP
jgi:hypothetical protein